MAERASYGKREGAGFYQGVLLPIPAFDPEAFPGTQKFQEMVVSRQQTAAAFDNFFLVGVQGLGIGAAIPSRREEVKRCSGADSNVIEHGLVDDGGGRRDGVMDETDFKLLRHLWEIDGLDELPVRAVPGSIGSEVRAAAH